MPTFSLLNAPPNLTIQIQRIENAPLPIHKESRSFGE